MKGSEWIHQPTMKTVARWHRHRWCLIILHVQVLLSLILFSWFFFFFLLIITAVIVIWNTSCVQLIHRVHLVNFHYFRVIRLMYLSLFNRFKYKWISINLWTIVLNYFDYLIRYECNFLCYLIHLQLNAAIVKVILIADHITLFINNWIFQWKLTDELLDK